MQLEQRYQELKAIATEAVDRLQRDNGYRYAADLRERLDDITIDEELEAAKPYLGSDIYGVQ